MFLSTEICVKIPVQTQKTNGCYFCLGCSLDCKNYRCYCNWFSGQTAGRLCRSRRLIRFSNATRRRRRRSSRALSRAALSWQRRRLAGRRGINKIWAAHPLSVACLWGGAIIEREKFFIPLLFVHAQRERVAHTHGWLSFAQGLYAVCVAALKVGAMHAHERA